MKMKRKPNLSDKISAALAVQPRPDLEDDVVFSTKPKILTRDQLSSSEDEVEISDFRKRNVQLLSDINDKYKGEVVSRKDLQTQSEESEKSEEDENSNIDSDENVVSSSTDAVRKPSDSEVDSDEDEESDDYDIVQKAGADSDSEESGSDEDEEGYDISQMEEPPKETFQHMTAHNVSEEVRKGQCVRNQLLVWENLLEMRIHMQRCVNTANRLPLPDVHKELRRCGGEGLASLSDKTRRNVSRLLDKLLLLQKVMLKNITNSTTKKEVNDSNVAINSDEEIPSDEEITSEDDDNSNIKEHPSKAVDTPSEDEAETKEDDIKSKTTATKKRKLSDYEDEISKSHKAFKTFQNSTIQKWNDKTRLITATANKNTTSNPILSQIDYILSDREKLIRRTQLKRSEYEIVGYKKQVSQTDDNADVEINHNVRDRKEDDEYIPEIFDDSDFYHQMLRELIECKSADISDPIQLSRQWITLQQMRSKMKRKVDTKATKGRRIKYVVHNKLINFMAPDNTNVWNDSTSDELYSSLFGKMFENNSEHVPLSEFRITTSDV